MPGHVLSFPGHSCRFYASGRCLYEERMNPGLEQRWRCRVLHAWAEAYDQLLDQAEVFSLEDEMAMAIWRKRMVELAPPGQWCADYIYAPDQDPPFAPLNVSWNPYQEMVTVECLHGVEDMCVNALPICHGVCPSFAPRAGEDAKPPSSVL